MFKQTFLKTTKRRIDMKSKRKHMTGCFLKMHLQRGRRFTKKTTAKANNNKKTFIVFKKHVSYIFLLFI